MKLSLLHLACLVAVGPAPLVAQPPLGQPVSRPVVERPLKIDGTCHLSLCRVLTIDDVQVPALEDGPLVAVHVKDGDFVQKGALLAQINDDRAQLELQSAQQELDAATLRASDDINVRYAQASFEVADAELQQGLELNRIRQHAISASEIRRRRLARYRAELEIDKSQLDLKVARMNAAISKTSVALAEESIRRRKIISPVDGIVVPVYRGEDNQRVCQVGQWVHAGEPVVRIIRMDRLHVEGLVSAAEYDPAQIDGRPVTVHAELARGRQVEFSGSIVFISPVIDTRNNYRVRAEVANRMENGHWLLRPGTTASMTIHLQ